MSKIAGREIEGKVLLGPMAGVTNLAYREFMKPFGVGLTFSEMISDCGISFNNKRTYEYLKTSTLEKPVALQLFGFDIKNSLSAIKSMEATADYEYLDLNFGCPVTKVVKTGAGSAWLRNPESIEMYTKEVVAHSHKPVTAKIRLGWDENSINVYDIAERLERAGVVLITIHCRTRSQGYSGTADYGKVSKMKEHISIPFAISGDIFKPEDAKRAIDETGAEFVMVARGGVGHPFLVTQINRLLEGGVRLPDPDPKQQALWAEEYAKKVISLRGEAVGVKELRSTLPHFFSGFPGYKKIRNMVATSLTTEDQMMRLLHGIQDRGEC